MKPIDRETFGFLNRIVSDVENLWVFFTIKSAKHGGVACVSKKRSSKIENCVCYNLVYEINPVVQAKVDLWYIDHFSRPF